MNRLAILLAGAAVWGACHSWLWDGGSSWAQSTEPVLALETGHHTGRITRIALDSLDRLLVTAGTDKTARVWDISSGREPLLLRTLRPPVAAGHEGKLYALAISPDGKTVACAGQTGKSWEGESFVYLFDTSTGELVSRTEGQPASIHHLAYSPDGKWLAATLYKGGIRLFRAGEKEATGLDQQYGAAALGADFHRGGKLLATTCLDGSVRLYDLSDMEKAREKHVRLAPVSSFRPQGGSHPLGIAFSPDGTKLAVGFREDSRVEVLDLKGHVLSHSFSPDTSGVPRNHGLQLVAWSWDGTRLYAAGAFGAKGVWKIRRWDKAGKGSYEDIPAAKAPVSHMLPMKSGGIAFSTTEPASFGILDAGDKIRFLKEAPTPNHRFNAEKLLISDDGWTVGFCLESMGREPAVFSVSERSLFDPTESIFRSIKTSLSLEPPSTEGTEVKDWKNSPSPKFGEKPLPVPGGGLSRSLAVLPDRSGFALGSDWAVSLFDKLGRMIWTVPTQAAFAVNTNGKLIVAAMGDGTIRWFRGSDGKELLALFPHKDRKRWILWTPSGYYHASPGGEDLIGWHVNRSRDREGDFFPASRFRSVYSRPDVVDKLMVSLDEKEALLAANRDSDRKLTEQVSIEEKLPPVVRILSPAENTEVSTASVTVRYSVRSRDPLTGLRALVDGRPVLKLEDPSKLGEKGELSLSIPPRDCEISLVAENRHAASEPATLRLKWRGAAAKEEFRIRPKLYVLAVGVANYQDQGLRLGLSAKDAMDFGEIWKRQQSSLYEGVQARILTDAQATKGNILDGLEWLQREVTQKDVAILFLAGHGINDPNGMFYFLPVDADLEKLKRTGISQADITSTVAAIAGKVLVFIDACHSGNIMGKMKRRAALDVGTVVNELASAENGAIVFSSATGRQYSLENPQWGNGAFTRALVEGIGEKADFRGTGRITVNMLDLDVSERVKELTEGQQTPTTVKPPNVPDFPVAVRK
jgi:WD40 repeat protein